MQNDATPFVALATTSEEKKNVVINLQMQNK